MTPALADELRRVEGDLARVTVRLRTGGLQGRAIDAARALILAVADELDRADRGTP